MFDSAASDSFEPVHGFGGADDADDEAEDDMSFELDPELPADDELADCDVACEVDGCTLDRCDDGGGGGVVSAPAAAPVEPPEASTRTVSTMSRTNASTEAKNANRRRQYTDGG